MKIHHLNCATFCPPGGKLINRSPAKLVCHCLLIESNDGLILVDSGLGLKEVTYPNRFMVPGLKQLAHPSLKEEETAIRQVERLGFKRADVRHIIVTHLDVDHAGGLSDFPDAKIHLMLDEHDAALAPKSTFLKLRYHSSQWAHRPNWVTYEPRGEKWFGFQAVRQLEDLPPEILLIPLVGHTPGHAGVAVQTKSGWLLHAGDAYFYEGEVHAPRSHCTPGLDALQRAMETDRPKRLENQRRLHSLARKHEGEVKVFCAHDPGEFERFAST